MVSSAFNSGNVPAGDAAGEISRIRREIATSVKATERSLNEVMRRLIKQLYGMS